MTQKKYRFKRRKGMTEVDTHARVEITWIDPCSDASWLSIKEFTEMEVATCKSAGRIYSRDKGLTRIYSDYSLDDKGNIDTVGNVTIVPNVLIKHIKVFK
jgi:hypothetical protein